VFAPDKEHLHHQLREIGHSHRQAVLLMYVWSIVASGSALAIAFINGRGVIIAILAGAAVLIALTLVPNRVRQWRAARSVRRANEAVSSVGVGSKPL
jgi:UDP-GlcNAc:undecaprenyl-phosphate GlcNAc-1-phosphate transferase